MQQQANYKIISFEDIQTTIRQYREYLEKHGIIYSEMEEEKIAKINDSTLTAEEKETNIRNVKDIYLNAEKGRVKQMLFTFFATELRESQLKLDEVFNFIDHKLDILEKEFSFGFNKEDKLELAFEVQGALFESLTGYTTMLYQEKEIAKMKDLAEAREKLAEANKKHNRSFGRETEVSDSMENK